MKLSSRVAVSLLQVALTCLCITPAFSQIRDIDSSKLPQNNSAVQHAYADLLPIDQYARTPEENWHYPVPKDQVTARFLAALRTLEAAQKQAPDNKELQLFTGLVAHLAYNLDIDEAYDLPPKFLQPQVDEDFRAAWFLGIHQCQSEHPVTGMQRLLKVETSSTSLPGDFWVDYADCATIANMPVHAVRAYDIAHKAADKPPIDDQREQTARNRIKPSSVKVAYPQKQAWYNEKTPAGNRYTSDVCGESFIIKPTFHLKIGDVQFGTCPITIDTEQYPSRYGPSSASMLLTTQVGRPEETLETFAHRILEAFAHGESKEPHHETKLPLNGIKCPVETCLAYEVITNSLYQAVGGAHLIAVFFQSDQPEYPGLRFETPQPSPKVSYSTGPLAFFRPEETPQRFNGTLFTVVTLDSNEDIYPRARADFDVLLKSLVVDSK